MLVAASTGDFETYKRKLVRYLIRDDDDRTKRFAIPHGRPGICFYKN